MSHDSSFIEVDGKDCGNIILYALNTCGWCKKVRNLLEINGIRFKVIYVDLLTDLENLQISQEIEKWNPDLSFPTLVLHDSTCIIGFQEQEISDWISRNS